MRGFSYHRSPLERHFGWRPTLVLDRALIASLIAVGGALLLLAAVAAIERARVVALDGDLAMLDERLAQAQHADANARRLDAAVSAQHELAVAVAQAHVQTIVATNTIVRVGNRLPAQTWLTTVHAEPTGSWSIGGRSTRLDEVATTLRAVAALDPAATTRLVAVTASGAHLGVLDFTIAVDHGAR
jgi:Tfp pilus assembly protein PilN